MEDRALYTGEHDPPRESTFERDAACQLTCYLARSHPTPAATGTTDAPMSPTFGRLVHALAEAIAAQCRNYSVLSEAGDVTTRACVEGNIDMAPLIRALLTELRTPDRSTTERGADGIPEGAWTSEETFEAAWLRAIDAILAQGGGSGGTT